MRFLWAKVGGRLLTHQAPNPPSYRLTRRRRIGAARAFMIRKGH